MSPWLRAAFAALLVLHGAIHLLGAAKGLGWADVDTLRQPIGAAAGAAWLMAGALVVLAAVMLVTGSRGWWVCAGVAAVVSQAMVVTAWSDAWAATAVNVALLLAAGYGLATYGPGSLTAQYEAGQHDAAVAVASGTARPGVVTEADLAALPQPLAECVRASGAVGRPRVTGFTATLHGRIRSGPGSPWMPFTGRQANTFGPEPTRYFLIEARKAGLPVWVFHAFDRHASMRARLLSVVPVADGSGPDLDRAETVTLFNDLVLFAPAALVDAPVRWEPVDDRHVRGRYTAHGITVTAEITLDDRHRVVDFVSDDRLRASADGRSYSPQRWSTPVTSHRTADGFGLLASGAGVWHAPEPEGTFDYLQVEVDSISYTTASYTTASYTPAHPRAVVTAPLSDAEPSRAPR